MPVADEPVRLEDEVTVTAGHSDRRIQDVPLRVEVVDREGPVVEEAVLVTVGNGVRDRLEDQGPGLEVEEPLFRYEDGEVELLEQTSLRRVQTPQAFHAKPLLLAYRRAKQAGFQGVDTAETIERFSDLSITVVPGDPHNIKVTFVEDFFTAEDYALRWDTGRWVEHNPKPT